MSTKRKDPRGASRGILIISLKNLLLPEKRELISKGCAVAKLRRKALERRVNGRGEKPTLATVVEGAIGVRKTKFGQVLQRQLPWENHGDCRREKKEHWE